jgi:hypothetical protein
MMVNALEADRADSEHLPRLQLGVSAEAARGFDWITLEA